MFNVANVKWPISQATTYKQANNRHRSPNSRPPNFVTYLLGIDHVTVIWIQKR